MGLAKIRRVPVLRRDRRMVGMLSLADVARTSADAAGGTLAALSQRGGPHSQVPAT
jgi:CBS domain-containing protein